MQGNIAAETILFFCSAVILVFICLMWISLRQRNQEIKRRLENQLPHEKEREQWQKLGYGDQAKIKSSYKNIFWFVIVPLALLFFLSPFGGIRMFSIVLLYLLIVVVAHIIFDSMRRQRESRFTAQLPLAIDILIEQLSAGRTIIDAIKAVGNHARAPLNKIFRQIGHRIALGQSLGGAMDAMVQEHTQEPFIELAHILKLHEKTGADIVPNLKALIETVEHYIEQSDRARTATEQGRISGIIVGIVPFIAMGFVYLVKPDFVMPLWTQTAGLVVLLVCGFMLVAGILLLYRIISVKL